VLPRLPYALVYRAEADSSVTILRFLHTSRIWPEGL
jgi:plasmid stabilization system protein ParE